MVFCENHYTNATLYLLFYYFSTPLFYQSTQKVHIFCTECGKHIDVSLEELENQSGHLVCPQCLAEIDVDVDLFNGNETNVPVTNDDDNTRQHEQHTTTTPTPSTATASSNLTNLTHQPQPSPSSTPPQWTKQPQHLQQPSSQSPLHIDDVMRYCKHCGAFLKEGVNFCPKCGKYVRVSPPINLKTPATASQQDATRMRSQTPPNQHIPQNKQSIYRPPQPSYQETPVKHRNSITPTRNGTKRRASSNSTQSSKFSILSLGGCLTFTIIAVALFFIVYIIIGVNYD